MQYTTPGPYSVAELADACKNDADLIYQYVYNNVDFYPFFGVQKGALGCLIDGMGGPWDQCQLLVETLRQAGYTANYIFGTITLDSAQYTNLFGTTGQTETTTLLTNAGVPYTTSGSDVTLDHVWVQINIGGTYYSFDPSFKTYSYTTGIDIATASGFSRASLVAAAEDGATITSDSVQGLNRVEVRSYLTETAIALQNYIQDNNYAAHLDDVVGGKAIVQSFVVLRQTSLSYQTSILDTWTGDIPDAYRTTVEVQYGSIDETFYSDDINYLPLSMTFDDDNLPILKLNGIVVTTGTSAPDAASYTITFASGMTVSGSSSIPNTSTYSSPDEAIVYRFDFMWGPMGDNGFAYNRFLWNQGYASATDGFTPAINETIDIATVGAVVYKYFSILTRNLDILGRLRNCTPTIWVHGGVSSQQWTDVSYTTNFDFSLHNMIFSDLATTSAYNSSCSGVIGLLTKSCQGTALIDQYGPPGNVVDCNMNRVIEQGIYNGYTFYDANSSNWSSTEALLSGWSSDEIAYINAQVAANNRCVISGTSGFDISGVPNAVHSPGKAIPFAAPPVDAPAQDPPTSLDVHDDVVGGPGGSEGGSGGPSNPLGGTGGDTAEFDPFFYTRPQQEEGEIDPVGVSSGRYISASTDLVVGSAESPYSLSFQRFYDSDPTRNVPYSSYFGSFGNGWTHNWSIVLITSSDVIMTLGGGAALFSTPNIVALYAASALTSVLSTDAMSNVLTQSVCINWAADLAVGKTTDVYFPQSTDTFMTLPDATVVSILGTGATLTGTSTVVYTTKNGVQYTFTDVSCNQITYPNGPQITLTFATSGSTTILTVANNMGRQLQIASDSSTRAISSVTDDSRTVNYSYLLGNLNLTDFTDARGNTASYAYNDAGAISSITQPVGDVPYLQMTYDTMGRVKTQIYGHNLWTCYFSGFRNVFEDILENSRYRIFDYFGNAVSVVDELGNATANVFDGFNRTTQVTMPEGNQIQLSYDSRSNVLSMTQVAKPGSGLSNLTRSYTYDSTWNKPVTITDENGNEYIATYDATYGNLLTFTLPTVAAGTAEWTLTYSRGQVISITDPLGIVTSFSYDSTTEELLSVTRDSGSLPHLNLVWSFTYDAAGNVAAFTDPNSNVTSYTNDLNRELTQITAPSPFSYVRSFTYDNNGSAVSIVESSKTNSYAYDVINDLVAATDPMGNRSSFQFNTINELEKFIDAENRSTGYNYDPCWRLTTVNNPDGISDRSFSYTDNGRLASATDENENTTGYAYDGFDRLSTITYPDGSSESLTYDANSNVLTWETRGGVTITYAYDALNQVTSKTVGSQPTIIYTYTLRGQLLTASTAVVVGNPATGIYTFSYDNVERSTSEENPDGKTVAYQYDGNGNLTQLTWPDGYYASYSYDALNRLTSIKLNGASSSAVQFAYDAYSRRTTRTDANGVITNYAYDLTDNLETLTIAFVGSGVSFTHSFNRVNEITNLTLTEPAYLWMPSAGTINYGTPNNLNQVPSINSASLSYSTAGCLTSDGTWTFTYDGENQLTAATKTGMSASYDYDPFHRRAQSTVGSTATRFFYSFQNRIADYDESDDLVTRYVPGLRANEAICSVAADSTVTYFHHDRMGSVIANSDSSGTAINNYSYGPFGETSSAGTFGYTAQVFDSETGLYYFKARHYSPVLKRFLQPDPRCFQILNALGHWLSRGPLGEIAETNLYTYVRNNPLSFVDPLGLDGARILLLELVPPNIYHVGLQVEVDGQYWNINGVFGGNPTKPVLTVYVDPAKGPADMSLTFPLVGRVPELSGPSVSSKNGDDACMARKMLKLARDLAKKLKASPVPYAAWPGVLGPATSETSNQVTEYLIRASGGIAPDLGTTTTYYGPGLTFQGEIPIIAPGYNTGGPQLKP